MRPILIILFFLLMVTSAKSQKWQTGYFTDVKGSKTAGFIYANPGGSGPIKNEGFIEFKEDTKADAIQLSTSDLQSFVAGKDSFVVAHAPGNETWAKKDYDFVKVVLDEDIKIYATRGAGSGGGSKVHVSPGFGLATGGGYGTSYGGGLGISFGGGGNGGSRSKTSYYYGTSAATMQHLTSQNFIDIMSEAMADEPEVVERIRTGQYTINNMDKLVAYFEKLQSVNQTTADSKNQQ